MQYVNQEFLNKMETLKEKEMLEALTDEFKTMFPSRTRVLGAENLNLFLTHQQKRAKYYNYLYYDDLKRYALIAFYLGTYFDEDSLYPWVKNILEEDESFGVKVDSLMEQFQKLSQDTLGKDFIYFLEALERLHRITPRLAESFSSYDSIVKSLTTIYPQRVEAIGKDWLYKELKSQEQELKRVYIDNSMGAFVYVTTKFMLGSYVTEDPLYAWVGKYVHKYFQSDKEKSRVLFVKGQSRVRKEILEMKKIRKKGE